MKSTTKILLTGAAGRVGRSLRELDGAKYGSAIEWVGLDIINNGDAVVRESSFTDAEILDELLPGCDAVIHTAALHGRHRKTHTPTQFTEVNVAGLVTLLEACLRHGVRRCVFSSSMDILVGMNWAASGMAVLDERTKPTPDWIYAANKLLCEELGLFYNQRYGLEFVALRYMAFTGTTKPGPGLLAREIMPHDVATANLLAALKPNIGYEVFNIGPDSPLTNADIVQSQTDTDGVMEKYWPGASEVLRTNNMELKPTDFWPVTRIKKAQRLLGWQPEYTFTRYLQSLGWKADA